MIFEYRINPDEGIVVEDAGNLGGAFYKPPWRAATQEEIDEYLLAQAKSDKIVELKGFLSVFFGAGYSYNGNFFGLTDDVTENIQMKNSCSPAMLDRYCFCDLGHDLVDFVDAAGFTAFMEEIFAEKDRVMVKYNAYKLEIASCKTIACVGAIVVSFDE